MDVHLANRHDISAHRTEGMTGTSAALPSMISAIPKAERLGECSVCLPSQGNVQSW